MRFSTASWPLAGQYAGGVPPSFRSASFSMLTYWRIRSKLRVNTDTSWIAREQQQPERAWCVPVAAD